MTTQMFKSIAAVAVLIAGPIAAYGLTPIGSTGTGQNAGGACTAGETIDGSLSLSASAAPITKGALGTNWNFTPNQLTYKAKQTGTATATDTTGFTCTSNFTISDHAANGTMTFNGWLVGR